MYMKSTLCSIFLFLFFLFSLHAQIDSAALAKEAEGKVGISDADLVDFLMVSMPHTLSARGESSTLKFQSLKTYMMPPRKADETGNPRCYAVTACAEYYANYDKNYKVNLSPDYIDLSLAKNNISEALGFLVRNGTVSADIVPFGSKFIPSTVRATQKYAMQNYLYLFRKESKPRQKIFALRKALMRGNPVIVEMYVPKDFAQIRNQRLYHREKTMETKAVPFVVVGYDEESEIIELLGTYGSNWADNGYLQMDYEDFSEMAETAFVLVPTR